MARKRKRTNRRTKKNPEIAELLMSKGAYLVYGAALGFAARQMIADTMAGEFLDDTIGKLFGDDDDELAIAEAVDGTYFGAIGMGAVHDPYGAVGIGAVQDPYGAVHINPYGAVHTNPHDLRAEWAARNTIHSAMSRGGIA